MLRFQSFALLTALVLGGLSSLHAETGDVFAAPDDDSRLVRVDFWYVKTTNGRSEEQLGFEQHENDPTVLGTRKIFRTKIESLRQQGRLRSVYHVQSTTVTGRELTIQIGERKPVVTGATRGRTGSISQSISFMDVGWLLRAEPVIQSTGLVRVSVNFEESSLVPSDVAISKGGDGENVIKATGTEQVTSKTIVDAKPGFAHLLARTEATSTARTGGHVLVMCVNFE